MSELMSILPSVVSMMMQDKLARDKMATDKERFELTTKATSEFRAGQVKRDIAATDAATQRHLSDQTLAGIRYDAQTKRDIQQHQQLLKLKEIEAGLATDRYTAQVDRDIQQHQAIMDEKALAAKLSTKRYEADRSFKEEQARLETERYINAQKIATERNLKEMELKKANQQAIIDKMELYEEGRVKRHKETQKQITDRTELEQQQRKDELAVASVREGNRNINALLALQQKELQFYDQQELERAKLEATEEYREKTLDMKMSEQNKLKYEREKLQKRPLAGYDHFDRVIKDEADDIFSDESAMIETWYNTSFQQMIAGDVDRLQDVKKGEPGYENKIQLLNKLIEYKELFAPSTEKTKRKSPFYDSLFGDPVPETVWPFTKTTEYNEAQNIGANLELLISLLSQ